MKTYPWAEPVYKRLAGSELGAGHTGGIVPIKETEGYFGKLSENETKTALIEFWFEEKSKTFKTHIIYYYSPPTHDHYHITGNIFPAYKNFGAKKGDLIVFWRNLADESRFKAELIKESSDRWNQIKSKGKFPSAGGLIKLLPPTANEEIPEIDEETLYQTISDVDVGSEQEKEIGPEDFPPQEKMTSTTQQTITTPPRDKAKGDFVLKQNNYKCQLNSDHETFPTNNAPRFMEKHHLIPMSFYDQFETSIDDISNITCLCPTCHKQLHYGVLNEKKPLIQNLLEQQSEEMAKRGIAIDLENLLMMY